MGKVVGTVVARRLDLGRAGSSSDHDPSGIDMTRDITDRLVSALLAEHHFGAPNPSPLTRRNPPEHGFRVARPGRLEHPTS